MTQRLIRTSYDAGLGRTGRSSTLEGALRAAITRVAMGQAAVAEVYDERFGLTPASRRPAVTVRVYHETANRGGLSVTWYKPKWGKLEEAPQQRAAGEPLRLVQTQRSAL
jgi:hypothetical protein